MICRRYCIIFSIIFSGSAHSITGPVLLVVGTRPEGIKMIPVYIALKEEQIPVLLCSTGQHTDLLEDIFAAFSVEPDFRFNIMKPGQDLFYITTTVLDKMKMILQEIKPSLVIVQGDTTSAMAAALAAFYLKIPVGHVEAGLRTGNINAPYPEEMNRTFISLIASYHFAPTALSVNNLLKEHIDPTTIFCVGNTVVDALAMMSETIRAKENLISKELEETISWCKKNNKKIVLLTAHRRESFDIGLVSIFRAIQYLLQEHSDLAIIYPMHPNPIIKRKFLETDLNHCANIFVTAPLNYTDMIYLLNNVDFVATDSGGIQEEAVSLGKPVLVLRNETDRPEGVLYGAAQLVGTDTQTIIDSCNRLLTDTPSKGYSTIYGDGTASKKIAKIVTSLLKKGETDVQKNVIHSYRSGVYNQLPAH